MTDTINSSGAVPVARARLLMLVPSLDQLWLLLALVIVGSFIALVPVVPNDFWWHLKAGALIAETGRIPTTNIFAWTLPADAPYVYATWLGEWLFYQLYLLGGLELVVFVARNLLGLVAFGLVGIEAQRRSGSWRLAALAVLIAGAMASNNFSARTQNWSWVPFAAYALLLGRYAAAQLPARYLVALPLLMAFWVNAHGAFVLGLGLVGVFVVGETLRHLLRQPGALSRAGLRPLYLTLAATLAATLLNPLGPGIFGYVRDLLTDAPSQGLIVEWQPPTTRSFAGGVFYASVLLLAVAWAYARRRPSATDVLLACAFAWLAWGGMRYVVWFGMAAMPLLMGSLARGAGGPAPRRAALTLLPALLLMIVWLVVQPWLKPLGLFGPEAGRLFATVDGVAGVFSNSTPADAAEYLRRHPGGRLFNEMGYGSYLIWALGPEQQVFIDPRVELFPYEQWQDYVAVSEARDYNRVLARYGADRILLGRAQQPKLAEALASDPLWQREYADAQAEIWRRR